MRASLLRFSLGLLCLGLTLPSEALAARKAAPSRPTKTMVRPKAAQPDAKLPPAAPQTAWTAAEPASCGRVRRKLWQAEEGWIVKTVTVCH
ncbi:MAG TPA: hypothetical protein VGU70_04655 [Methylobacterium sp.]|uniref:hypothetical protein n=1 Tax=Methylorubrum sp. B1-46 TaxID=2897334 RepID=UPI001E5FC397|nr:hypothetical protein [Methylorubrum sp. B1-46]UGB26435.1 hypothetical protein LPC10_02120 [Methylorubrum sp. B1-46]HEV2542038.1 hypothetical protein [Methylobacterium sp.]